MKMYKLLGIAAMMTLAACSSGTPEQEAEVAAEQDIVTESDPAAIEEAKETTEDMDENGGSDADYGTPENSDDTAQ